LPVRYRDIAPVSSGRRILADASSHRGSL